MITEFQKQKILKHFSLYDFDKNGVLEKADFEQNLNKMMQGNGWATDSPEYKKVYASFVEKRWASLQKLADPNNDNKITPDEYLQYVDKLLNNPEMYEAEIVVPVKGLFKSMDKDGDGHIDLEEYKNLYANLGFDEGIAPEIFSKLELNYDGHISEDEYLKLIDQFFTSQNPEDPGNLFFGSLA